ncbi:MAG TPA: D-2-hydroxyacid dehydrogenase family protein [Chloroflexota bacterium]|nr:D-2-hydroxyacid dehydrogenase family protein [Chloroflexota bacterium]
MDEEAGDAVVRIAILDDYQGVALQMADWGTLPTGTEVQVFRDHLADEVAVAERLADFEVVVAMRERTPFPRRLLERLPKLRLLVTTGMRNASIDLAAATERGIVVCGTGGVGAATAELTWGLILALLRQIPREDAATRGGAWQVSVGVGLHDKTLGVLGLGNLGSRVATVGRAFGMRVIAWSQNLTAARAAEVGATLVGKDELLAQADILSIHLVLSERTRGLIGARELALMKPTAYLVNTSRGPIVDEAALIDALRRGAIAGAALDVFDVEPLPAGHPLRSLPNTVITPHLGYVTAETYRVFFGDAVEDIRSFLAGTPVRVLSA